MHHPAVRPQRDYQQFVPQPQQRFQLRKNKSLPLSERKTGCDIDESHLVVISMRSIGTHLQLPTVLAISSSYERIMRAGENSCKNPGSGVRSEDAGSETVIWIILAKEAASIGHSRNRFVYRAISRMPPGQSVATMGVPRLRDSRATFENASERDGMTRTSA